MVSGQLCACSAEPGHGLLVETYLQDCWGLGLHFMHLHLYLIMHFHLFLLG